VREPKSGLPVRVIPKDMTLESYVKRVLVATGVVGLALLGALLVWRLADILLLAFIGLLFGVFLDAASSLFRRYLSLPRGWSLALTLVLLAVGAALALSLLGPTLAAQAVALFEGLPQFLQDLEAELGETPWYESLRALLPAADEDTDRLGQMLTQVLAQTTQIITSLTTLVFYGVFVFFVGLFLAVHPRYYQEGIVSLWPLPRRRRAREVTSKLGYTLRAWLVGQLISMLLIGTVTGAGLWLLGVPLALVLGVIAALFEFIPNIGPVLAAVPAVLLAFAQSPTLALYVALFYLVIQQLEGNVVHPLIQRRAVDLPPVLGIVGVFAMASLLGLLGALVAAPLLALLLVLVRELYLRDTLGDARAAFPRRERARSRLPDR
jgi:predicted PurR-regulated permease PerM